MKKAVLATVLSGTMLASSPVLADNAAKPVMDESTIVMSTQSGAASQWIIPLLLLLLVAAAASSTSGGSVPSPE